MPALQLFDLSAATPDGHELFSHLDLTFPACRTGLVGRNGVGKTTLLRILLSELQPKSGHVLVDGRLGVLRQNVRAGNATVADALGIASDLSRLERLDRGAPLADDLERADWTLPARLAQSLANVGLPDLAYDRPLPTLSGGERTRLSLAALLLDQPDFLLLDEPTNNLDADGRAAVAGMLRNWRGGAILVSHDRELLGGMDQIVELTSLGAKTYGGNWDAYQARRDLDLAAAEHRLADAEQQLAEVESKARERAERKARSDSRGARMAKRGGAPRIITSGLKRAAENTSGALSRLGERQHTEATQSLHAARADIEILAPLAVTLPATRLPSGRTVLLIENLTGGAADSAIIRNLSLNITGPARVAITGPNGSGKTTLLRLATGALPPASGTVRITPRHVMLDQQVLLLDPARTIRENYLRLNPGDGENACRAALARFTFRADAALKRVGDLSGGEMLRAGLAATIGSTNPPELLILDEPTNHLDLDAIAAIEAGLRAYDGALLVVSHDRAFLDAIGIEQEIVLGE